MNTTNSLIRFAFMLALIFTLTPAHAALTGGANSKGRSMPKFDASATPSSQNNEEENDDDDSPRAKSSAKIPVGFKQRGEASFYGGYWHGRKTADGEIYNQNTFTAAHKTLPFNSRVKVRNLLNNKEVVVRINNRGPYRKGRIIDLSVAAANVLDMRKSGVAPVEILVIQ